MLPRLRALCVVLALALGLLVAVPAALASPEAVLVDYAADGVIDGKYSIADLNAALRLKTDDPNYGAYRELVTERMREVLYGATRAKAGEQQSQEATPADAQRQAEIDAIDFPSPTSTSPEGSVPWAFVVLSVLAGLLLAGGVATAAWRRLRGTR
jgi:hypothetical protein